MQGKVALVIGGYLGIGRAVCRCLAMEGASVAFTYVKSQEDKDAEDTMRLLRKSETNDTEGPICIAADVGSDSFSEEDVARFGSSVPMGRAGQPIEIAPCYVFLASSDSSYITGQVLHPNGGVIVNEGSLCITRGQL